MATTRLTEILVGGGAMVVGATFLVWAFTGGGIFGEEGYPLTARFKQVDGLGVGSQVRMSGILVGHVQAQEYDPEARQAVITMLVAHDVAVPQDSSASIVQNGVMGEKYVDLYPGGATEAVPPGGEIRYTQSSVLVIDIIERIVRDAERRRTGGGEAE